MVHFDSLIIYSITRPYVCARIYTYSYYMLAFIPVCTSYFPMILLTFRFALIGLCMTKLFKLKTAKKHFLIQNNTNSHL